MAEPKAMQLIEDTLAGMPAAWTPSATLTQLRARIFDMVDAAGAEEAERLLESLADMNVAGIDLATVEAIVVEGSGMFARLLNDLFAQRHRHVAVHGLAQTPAARRVVAGIVEAAAEQGLRNILSRFAIALVAAPTSTQAEAVETLVAAFWRAAAAGHVAVIAWFMTVPEMAVYLLNPAAQPFWHLTAMSADTAVADMILLETQLGAAMRRSRASADLDAIIEGALSRRQPRVWMTWLEMRGMLGRGLAATGTYTSTEAMLAWAVNNAAVDAATWLVTEKFDTARHALEAVAAIRITDDVARTLQRVVSAILRAPYNAQSQQQSRARVLADMIGKSGAREDLKRKFEALAAFTEWRETPASLGHLGQLLVVLVNTGLMTEAEAMAVNGWHDICATARPDDWLSVEAMRRHLAGNDTAVLGDYLPVFDASTQDPIPVADAWYVPRLQRCYRKSTLLEWTATFREQGDNPAKKLWPDDGLRNELSLAELFALGADPFNGAIWQPSLLQRSARLPANRVAVLIDTDRLLAAVREADEVSIALLGTLPALSVTTAVRRLNTDTAVFHVAYAPDGKRLAGADTGGNIAIWNTETGEEMDVLMADELIANCTAIAWSGTHIATAADNETINIWNADEGVLERSLQIPGGMYAGYASCLQFSPNGETLAAGTTTGFVVIWPVSERRERIRYGPSVYGLTALAFSPDGSRIAVTSKGGGVIRITNAVTGKDVRDIYTSPGRVLRSLASYTYDDVWRIAYGGDKGELAIIDADHGHVIRRFDGHGTVDILAVAVSPNGRVLAVADATAVSLWNAETGAELQRHEPNGEWEGAFRSIAFSPDGSAVAFASSAGFVSVWPVTAPA